MRRNTSNTSTVQAEGGGEMGGKWKKEFRKSAKTNYRVLLHAHENKKTQHIAIHSTVSASHYLLPACQSVAARGYRPSFGSI